MDRCLIASIAIRIMSDTRDEEQEQRWREKTRSRWIPRSNRTILYDTGNILNSIIPVI